MLNHLVSYAKKFLTTQVLAKYFIEETINY